MSYAQIHTVRNSNRRSFLTYILAGGVAMLAGTVLYPLLRYLIPPPDSGPTPVSVFAGASSKLSPNSGRIFRFGAEPGILIRTPGGELRAFNAVCTHLGCTVQYRADLKQIWCACHDGHYDLNGINIAGPPPRPLTQYKVNVRGDRVFASRES